MPIGNWNLQWLNHNSQRAYPLTERATKTDVTGTIKIPDNFIVGLYFPIHAGTSFKSNGFFIKNLLITPTGFNIVVGYSDGATAVDVAAANIVRSNYVPNRAYALGGIDSFSDSVGEIVLGVLDDVDLLPAGLYAFDQLDGEIEVDAIRPMVRAVSSLRVSNNQMLSPAIYGNVTLVAGSNIRIDINELEENETELVISAIGGLNLNQACSCETLPEPPCITCINGKCSTDGYFFFESDGCVEIKAIENGLSFTDSCCQPCCGCTELEAINNQLDLLGNGVATLQGFITRLGGEVSQMNLVVLGSRTGGCNTCAG